MHKSNKIIEVNSRATVKDFLNIPLIINKNDPNWIVPLENDIEAVFDKEKNKTFRHGEAVRWIMYNNEGELIGRVAAFINSKTVNSFKQPTGCMGFFECINDKDAAFALFDKCKEWLSNRDMEAMDGPVNFGERDRWWGLLVEGFKEPNYCTNYNPLYYRELFEVYGFKDHYKQYTYSMNVNDRFPEKYYIKAKRIEADPCYHFEHINKKKLEKYAEDFRYIYNKAWAGHSGVGKIEKAHAIALMKTIAPIMDEDLIWFAYYDSEPIGFFIMIPELNQIFKHINGKLNWMGKLKFLWYKWRGSYRKMFGLIFGIIPKYQGKGVEGAIIIAAANLILPKNKYDILEMNWIGDFNPKMMHLCESFGATIVKIHITFRKLFDENAIFERAPVIN